jgi:hypothetical protein
LSTSPRDKVAGAAQADDIRQTDIQATPKATLKADIHFAFNSLLLLVHRPLVAFPDWIGEARGDYSRFDRLGTPFGYLMLV